MLLRLLSASAFVANVHTHDGSLACQQWPVVDRASCPGRLANQISLLQVVVRCRPLSKQELSDGHASIVDVDESKGQVQLCGPDSANDQLKVFTFDQVYGMESQQREVFQVSAQPIVDSVMQGFNGTIFAYGQTGTGKTFTMEGIVDDDSGSQQGIMLNTFDHVFNRIQDDKGNDRDFLVYISYLEVYNEDVRDLLCKGGSKLTLQEQPGQGFYVKGLKQVCARALSSSTPWRGA